MSGSRPEPDAVTASGGTAAGTTPSRAAIAALRWLIVSVSFASNVPLFEPPDVLVSAGPRMSLAEAAGRVWKYGSAFGALATGSIPSGAEPAGVPAAPAMVGPFAGPQRPVIWATPRVTSG